MASTTAITIYRTNTDRQGEIKQNLKSRSLEQNSKEILNSEISSIAKSHGEAKSVARNIFEKEFLTPIIWKNVIIISLFHIVPIVWLVVNLCYGISPKWQTLVFLYFTTRCVGFGVTGGVHRYWTHRSYKAKLPLQIILMLCYSMAGQNTIFDWVRDHRVHHKFSETNADPHNVNRGFFFSHVGWLLMKKHPDVIKEGKKIDLSDIEQDPIVLFHKKYFKWLKLAFCFVLPSLIPFLAWRETWNYSILTTLIRYVSTLNFTWSVNSFAHTYGHKPYDKSIKATENRGVSIVAMGEGCHNYHHTFPWDYKTAELPYTFNMTTVLLDMFHKTGWAYDMKVASPTLIEAVAKKRGATNVK